MVCLFRRFASTLDLSEPTPEDSDYKHTDCNYSIKPVSFLGFFMVWILFPVVCVSVFWLLPHQQIRHFLRCYGQSCTNAHFSKLLKWLLFCIYWLLCFYLCLNVCICINVCVDCVYMGYTYFYIYLYFCIRDCGKRYFDLSVHTNWRIDNKVDFEILSVCVVQLAGVGGAREHGWAGQHEQQPAEEEAAMAPSRHPHHPPDTRRHARTHTGEKKYKSHTIQITRTLLGIDKVE